MRKVSTLSFFWRHIKPYKWYYLVILSGPIAGGFYPFFNNWVLKLLLDAMVSETDLTYTGLLPTILLFSLFYIVHETCWRIKNIATWKAEPYVEQSILLNSYNYVQHHSYAFFQNNFTGAISSKIKSILDGYDKFWAEIDHGLLPRVLTTIVSLSALTFVNKSLGLFLLAWCTVFMTFMSVLSMRLNRLVFTETESRHALMGQVSDKIANMISLFSFASRRKELDDLEHQIQQNLIPKQIKSEQYHFKMNLFFSIFYLVMQVFILLYMIHLRKIGLVSIGDFAFVFGLFFVVIEQIWYVGISFQDFSRAMGDLKSSLSILSTPQTNLDHPHAKSLRINKPSITFKNVRFAYNSEAYVFKNLNITIKPGEKIGLVGHSGAGKSSLINLLLRYFDPEHGVILIDNQNIAEVTQDSLREQIAVIPQDTMLFHRSLMENIRYGNPKAIDAEVIEASKKAHLHDYILTLPEGYNTFVGERGIKLSGGQRQRVAIARAILKDAPILILDEATSSLDSQTEQYIQDSLNRLIKDKKKTVIAIAHRLSTLKHMDRILVLDKGVIVEQGTHKELLKLKNSLYKKLWDHQVI